MELAAVNPTTGEVLEHLDRQPPETLAEALDAVHSRQADLKRWADALEAELRARLKVRQAKTAVFGDWEVSAAAGRERDWDADQLDTVLGDLVADGVVRAGDVADIVTRPPIVSKSRARDLLGRLTGPAAVAVAECFHWRETRGRLTVTRSVNLLPEGEETPPPTPQIDVEELFA